MILHLTDIEDTECWERNALLLKVETEDKTVELEFRDGEPEDAKLFRDFQDVYRIEEALKAAHEAGVRGETFTVYKERYNQDGESLFD